MIRKIAAKGNMVAITSDEDGEVLIRRREALQRAKAIVGIDRDSEWLVEQFVKAANQARINDLGEPYDSDAMELLLKTASEEAQKQPT